MPYAVEEAMNRLRINIKFCGKNTKKLLITSSLPNEGKSTISMNLWKMMAEAGFPTVFLDVDLRKSVIKSSIISRQKARSRIWVIICQGRQNMRMLYMKQISQMVI